MSGHLSIQELETAIQKLQAELAKKKAEFKKNNTLESIREEYQNFKKKVNKQIDGISKELILQVSIRIEPKFDLSVLSFYSCAPDDTTNINMQLDLKAVHECSARWQKIIAQAIKADLKSNFNRFEKLIRRDVFSQDIRDDMFAEFDKIKMKALGAGIILKELERDSHES